MSLKKISEYLSEASWNIDKGECPEDFEKGAVELLLEMQEDLNEAENLIGQYEEDNKRVI